MSIQVVNVRGMTPDHNVVDYVGRKWAGWNQSALGNPYKKFPKKMNTQPMESTIQMYRRWLWARIQANDEAVMKELFRLAWKAKQDHVLLGCWCHPGPCHADVVQSCVEWIIRDYLGGMDNVTTV